MAQVQVQLEAPVFGASAVAMNGGGVGQFPSTSLYVGDLEMNVTDSQLFDLFSQVGYVLFVRVCRDMNTGQSLGYAYVNFSNPVDAMRALDVLNFTLLNNKPIRIMYSNRNPSARKSGIANIFIKNLDKTIDNKALQETFSTFGTILSCKVASDPSGQSKGYGFVQFDREEAAQIAIEMLNGMLFNDKQVYIGPFLPKHEREISLFETKFNNVFIKNLSNSTTEYDLMRIFGEYGKLTSVVVMREADGKSKCFGFVNFENPDDAARVVQELNGKKFDDKEWFIGRAQKKAEREQELKVRFEQSMKETADKYQGANLYLKNLDASIGDEKLKELFSIFGTISSYKVMRDPNGISRGSGFVAFSTSEEASRALTEMNGKKVGSKPLYVAHAQRKEERRAKLQAQFSQMQPVSLPPNVTPCVPIYPTGAVGIGQLFYGQAPPTIIPSQPGFGYQQQLIPEMRPGGAPIPNFFVPLVQPGQQTQQPAGRRAGAGPMQQNQQPMPLLQQQMLPRGRVYHLSGPSTPDIPMSGVPGEMLSVPYDMGGMSIRDTTLSQLIPIGTLAFSLTSAAPEQQRTISGESLYPLVEQLERDHAAKVTRMLLEMDQTEVLHLLESPDALKAKVAEAMQVLRNVCTTAATDM